MLFLLGQGPVFIVEFFVDPKNGTLKTKKTTCYAGELALL